MIRLNDILDKVSAYNPAADLDLIKKAYVYSAKLHQGQVRKSGEPYIVHPMEVAGLLADLKLDAQSVAAGVLHDVVEDTFATAAEIEEIFGKDVAFLVDGVTKLSMMSFANKEDQQSESFRKMVVAMAKDIRVILIKLCDRLNNMRTLDHMSPEARQRIAQETMDIYAPLANRLGISWVKIELEDLSFRHLHPQEYQALVDKLAQKSKERQRFIDEVMTTISKKLGENNLKPEVHGRIKHLYSIYRKMVSQNIEVDQIYDIIAFRIILNSVPECYEALGLIHSMWKPVPGRFKDFIAIPKLNMYQSLHTTVIGPHGERIEIQIRTSEMHKVAEQGIAAHWRYKEGGKVVDNKDERRFAWLRQLMEWQKELKDPGEFMETVKLDMFADEVYVFTPKGDVVELPLGSTPIDFAYHVHTEVGNHCTGAKINGHIVPLKYRLKNGDTIEVTTSPTQKPSRDWLSFVATSRAKAKIRAVVKQEQRSRSRELGEEILNREFKKYGHNLQKLIKGGEFAKAAKELGLKDSEELIISVGFGKHTPSEILKVILPDEELGTPEKVTESTLDKLIKKVSGKSKTGVSIEGVDDVLVSFAKCCNPIPGDRITGFVTRGRGVTVHVADCPHVFNYEPERRVDVAWNLRDKVIRPICLRVITVDKPGVLAGISKAFSEHNINISEANCKVTEGQGATHLFTVGINDLDQLRAMMNSLMRLEGVTRVERVALLGKPGGE
ncbi:MAG: bifunctional (p)ppGpp synthetase/guanosine-3',5'-bis(diphosphate) 3'-pyrophosphohydrolase [Myxococcota bacterium]|jgi:GTP pyrophosphokinase